MTTRTLLRLCAAAAACGTPASSDLSRGPRVAPAPDRGVAEQPEYLPEPGGKSVGVTGAPADEIHVVGTAIAIGNPVLQTTIGEDLHHLTLHLRDGAGVIASVEQHQVQIWSATTGTIVRRLRPTRTSRGSLVADVSADGTWIALGLEGNDMQVYDTRTFTSHVTFRDVFNVEFTRDSKQLLVASSKRGAFDLTSKSFESLDERSFETRRVR